MQTGNGGGGDGDARTSSSSSAHSPVDACGELRPAVTAST